MSNWKPTTWKDILRNDDKMKEKRQELVSTVSKFLEKNESRFKFVSFQTQTTYDGHTTIIFGLVEHHYYDPSNFPETKCRAVPDIQVKFIQKQNQEKKVLIENRRQLKESKEIDSFAQLLKERDEMKLRKVIYEAVVSIVLNLHTKTMNFTPGITIEELGDTVNHYNNSDYSENKYLKTKWVRPISICEKFNVRENKPIGLCGMWSTFGVHYFPSVLTSLIQELFEKFENHTLIQQCRQTFQQKKWSLCFLNDHGDKDKDEINTIQDSNDYEPMVLKTLGYAIDFKTAFNWYTRFNFNVGQNVFENWINVHIKSYNSNNGEYCFVFNYKPKFSNNFSTTYFLLEYLTYEMMAHVWEKELVVDFFVSIFSKHHPQILSLVCDYLVVCESFANCWQRLKSTIPSQKPYGSI